MSTPNQTPDSFTHRYIPAFQKRVHRLGIVGNYGLDEGGIEAALDRGMNYVFFTPTSKDFFQRPIQKALRSRREEMVIASGATFSFFGGSVRRGLEKMLQRLETPYLDLLQLFWLGRTSAWSEGTEGELQKAKESGKAHAIGVSIHDRPRAGRLAEDSPLDALMIRYNASHPGAEQDIFPHCEKRRPAIIAYTATDWRKLLKAPRGWTGPVPTAGDCYRFCLSNPTVDLVLCGAGNQKELDENLKALEKGPLSPEEMAWMRAFGRKVAGKD
jgi:aryl-alcohol dehydrogenase-like predicted oxidoreductase